MTTKRKTSKTDKNRRKFLKLVAFGGVALLFAKLFGDKIVALAATQPERKNNRRKDIPTPTETFQKRTSGKDIDMIENDEGVVFVDKRTGEEIFILERD
jgi:hypothetical protein